MWSSEVLPTCTKVEQLQAFDILYRTVAYQELKMTIEETGCMKPCHYNEYKLLGEDKWSSLGYPSIILKFTREDLLIEKELKSYSGLSLLSDIGGSLGIFLGFSFLMVWDAAETVVLKIRKLFKGCSAVKEN